MISVFPKGTSTLGAIAPVFPVAQIAVLQDGTGRIGVNDRETGHVTAYLGETGAGTGAVVVLDPNGVRGSWAYGTGYGGRACVNHKLKEFCLGQGL